MRRLRQLVLLLVLVLFCLSAYGCNTVQGVGRDVEKAGEAIQDAFD